MNQQMRRKDQELSDRDTVELLEANTHGTLAIFDNEYPYSVPVSYVYTDGVIYFHGAQEGKKYALLSNRSKVSFSVVGQDEVQPEKFTTLFKSAIVFGKVEIVTDKAEIQKGMECTVKKYSPGFLESGRIFIVAKEGGYCLYKLNIDYMTGKCSKLLVKS